MNCPRCERDTLIEIDRQGITIDRCDKCRGIWLDRGELEKLVAAENGGKSSDREEKTARPQRQRDERDDRRRRDDDDDDDDDRRGGRRGGFLSNLFDFD
jgi:Zn-finger nucleic acid-binding protein